MGAVILRFYPNQKNPARKSGYGVYRVAGWRSFHRKWDVRAEVGGPAFQENTVLVLRTDRIYKMHSRVDPLKILLATRGLDTARKAV